jgi:hypothetical protein
MEDGQPKGKEKKLPVSEEDKEKPMIVYSQ